MAFRLKRTETVADGVRRIAREQVEHALDALADASLPPDVVVHQVRKHCKKLRALLRLVKGSAGKFRKRENRVIRDLARTLSATRDADVARRTWKRVVAGSLVAVGASASPPPTIASESGEKSTATDPNRDERLGAARATFLELLNRIPKWRLDERGFDALREGFESSYDRARKAMRAAARSGLAADHHEWRKHVKDHWYHLRLLQGVWPRVVRPEREAAHELGELLGDDHDLVILEEQLERRPRGRVNGKPVGDPSRSIKRERERLRRHARRVGSRLLAEPTSRRVQRFERLWRVWRTGSK